MFDSAAAAAQLSSLFARMGVPLTVADTPAKGKHVVATKDLAAGTHVFEEAPLVSWPFPSRRPGTFCDWCQAAIPETPIAGAAPTTRKAMRAAGVHRNKQQAAAARRQIAASTAGPCAASGCPCCFCSDDCRRAAAGTHQFLCGDVMNAIRKVPLRPAHVSEGDVADEEPPITPEALGRCVAAIASRYLQLAHVNPEAPSSTLFPLAAANFNRLLAPPDDAVFDEIDAVAWCDGVRAAMRPRLDEVGFATDVSEALLSAPTLMTLLGQLTLNSQALNLPIAAADSALGESDDGESDDNTTAAQPVPSVSGALFVLQSCFNHSCSPNAAVRFTATHEISIQLLRDVKAGEDVSITYVPELFLALEDFRARRERLRPYFFECACDRCTTESLAAVSCAQTGDNTPE